MKKTVCNVAYALLVLIYYSFFILDSALSDNEKTTHQIKHTDATFGNDSATGSGSNENGAAFKLDELVNDSLKAGDGNSDNLVFSEVTPPSADPSGIINDTPVILSLTDSATKELENLASIQTESLNKGFNDSQGEIKNLVTNAIENEIDSTLELNLSSKETEKLGLNASTNATQEKNEEIPSFSEWAQKQLEEVEKKEPLNSSTSGYNINNTKMGSSAKLRWKNYASVDCGAKVIQANSEAQNSWAILSPSRDEYKLNPCNSRVWFIVELCEAIQVKKIDLANYELFSSSPKDFTVSVSDRFPTRDWSVVGYFTAKDERDVQSFDLNHENFGKYIKIEIKSHYGSEHYCPLSLFRAYGTSVFEVLQKEDPAHTQPTDDDDDDDDEEIIVNAETSGNLLSSATDAVISMVKKAAQVLGNKTNRSGDALTIPAPLIQVCSSPSHYVVCKNCSDILFGKVYELLSCKLVQVKNLLKIPFVIRALVNSGICKPYGFDFRNKSSESTLKSCPGCVRSFFPDHYLGAMCNILAVAYNKVLYNVSYQYANGSTYLKDEKLVDIKSIGEKNVTLIEPTKPLEIEKVDVKTQPSSITESTNVSQIKPSKSLQSGVDLNSEIRSNEDDSQIIAETAEIETPKEVDLSGILPDAEAPKDNVIEIIEDNLDKLITEINAAEISSNVVSNTIPSTSNLQSQKESVFLRLANRIKALERNMSLSSQYLEELSKRYKKQVEEIQKILEKTVRSVEDISTKQEIKHKQLEERLEHITGMIEKVLTEKNNWQMLCYGIGVGFLTFLLYIFCGRSTAVKCDTQTIDNVTPSVGHKKTPLKVVASKTKSGIKKRRKSQLPRTDHDTTQVNGSDFVPQKTSTKIWFEEQKSNFIQQGTVIEDIPFALEEATTQYSGKKLSPILLTKPQLTKSPNTSEKLKVMAEKPKSDQLTPTNGNIVNGDGHTPKSSKKGIKKLFKKVF